jgi:cobalamin biosynthesis protein CobT
VSDVLSRAGAVINRCPPGRRRRITFEELSPDEFRSETEGSWPRPVVDMLLAACGATIGKPAFITATVADILGSAPRSFRQWVADHATAFTEGPAS